ncbi:MAG: sulfatase [Planctomycetaceae bacterium]|jgi:N-sulfoglucosamine sulfohydrolase|nr:sulfatase [Planctomycetaceae bacterium]
MKKSIFLCVCVFLLTFHYSLIAQELKKPLNVLLITADDMNYDSLGVTGCKINGITPNLDRLADGGILFKRAFVTASVCQTSRQVLMTGRYPHNNGGVGFIPINNDVPTLQESLEKAGYYKGIMAKVGHLAPGEKFHWDMVVPAEKLDVGRNPQKFYQYCTEFFNNAKKYEKPFFLMANSQDPHRPFAGSDNEQKGKHANQQFPAVSRTIAPEEIAVPGFLPELPDIRKEVAQYYTSVHRCDETVGKILQALKESGLEDNTLIMFLSDNGMSFPFSKTNVYRTSHQTPWIVRLPGIVKPGRIDETHFISGIDYMPTILDILALPQVEKMDGKSFLPLLKGETQPERDFVYTTFYQTSGKIDYPMRAIRTERFGYLFSPWSNGELIFKNESQTGLTFKAMQEAAKTDKNIAERVELFLKRVKDEFYDYEKDPGALKNLVADPSFKTELERHRKRMLELMQKTEDPLTKAFESFLKTGEPDLTGVNIGPDQRAKEQKIQKRQNQRNIRATQ